MIYRAIPLLCPRCRGQLEAIFDMKDKPVNMRCRECTYEQSFQKERKAPYGKDQNSDRA